MSPEAAIRAALRLAALHVQRLRALQAANVALALSGLVFLVVARDLSTIAVITIGLTATLAAGLAAAALGKPTPLDIAALIEHRTPASRNLILTAAELAEGRVTAPPAVTAHVFQEAARAVTATDIARLFPSSWTIRMAVICGIVFGVALGGRQAAVRRVPVVDAAGIPAISSVSIGILPPDYSHRPAVTTKNPDRIEALAGSRLRINVSATAAEVMVETISGSASMRREDERQFSLEIGADSDGYIALVPAGSIGAAGVRRLIGLSVIPDHAPRVRITAPARDIVLPDGQHMLPVVLEADDDLGLAELRLRYTRVSGSGENFSFSQGEVPLTITRTNDRQWNARVQWPLGALHLEPGDMVIYRGVALDARPGAPPAESDAFIAEVAAPGSSAADGFAIDDREDRYAISQQMVIVKTERLLGRRAGMAADEVMSATLDLAAEQRQVRAEFVFMMGGELADAGVDLSSLNEEIEAAGEEDLAAGRMANQGRLDILRAIRSMSRAAAKLADGDASSALPIEKEALAFLQRAFSKSRYILRTMGARERLDLSRRFSGVLAGLGRDTSPAVAPPPDSQVTELRAVLAAVAGIGADALPAPATAATLTRLAQRVLQIRPGDEAFRNVAAALGAVGAAIEARRGATEIAALRDQATTALAALTRRALPAGPRPETARELADLAGALAESLRKAGRQ